MKKNQRADCTGVWTLTEGGITKLATLDCLSGLWQLILCQKNHSRCKRRGGADNPMVDWIIGHDSSVPCDIIIYSCMASVWVKYTSLYIDLGLCHVTRCDQWDVSGGKVNRGWNVLTWLGFPLRGRPWEQQPLIAATHSAWDPNWRAADPNSKPGAQHSQPAVESRADHLSPNLINQTFYDPRDLVTWG